MRPAPSGGLHAKRQRKSPRQRKRRQKDNYGSEGTSLRIPARLHQTLEVALVRGARLRQASAGRREAEGGTPGEIEVGGRERHRNRASRQQAAHHHKDGSPRNYHRSQRRRD